MLVANQVLSLQIAQEIIPIITEMPNDFRKKQLWDFFPDLFVSEKEQYLKVQEAEEWEKFKERRRRFAAQHRNGGGVKGH